MSEGDMKHGIAIVVGLLLAAGPVAAQERKEFACGRSLAKDGAQPQLVIDEKLHVMDQTEAKFDPGTLAPGYAIKSIFCARSDIVPGPADYKVVAAGYPLLIFARDQEDRSGRTRIAVLEMSNGQLRMRSVGRADFTPDMVQRIQTVLDASLPQIGKTAPK
jgi:hypothetical protein